MKRRLRRVQAVVGLGCWAMGVAAGGAGDCVRGRIAKALAHGAELLYDVTTMHIAHGEAMRGAAAGARGTGGGAASIGGGKRGVCQP